MKPVEYIKHLIKTGHYTFTRDDAAEMLEMRGATLSSTLTRLKNESWIHPLSREFYLVLDIQHQDKGVLDPSLFVDEWADHMGVNYYLGGLSAAAMHGAAHQKPMQVQVFADRQIRAIKQPKIHIVVPYKKVIKPEMWEKKKTESGYFHLGTPEITAYDIVAYQSVCSSLDHAATVLVELGEAVSPMNLAKLPELACQTSVLQRLGYLLDRLGWQEKTKELHKKIERTAKNWVLLETRLSKNGDHNSLWRVIVNTDIQPDIER